MTTCIYSKNILWDDRLKEGYLLFQNGKIKGLYAEKPSAERYFDYQEQYVLAGFIDMHVHGGCGFDFANTDTNGFKTAVDYHLQHGTTTILPTVTSGKIENIEAALQTFAAFVQQNMTLATVAGVHLEGPYFSPAQCGAQDLAVITAPQAGDYKRLLTQYGKHIARWSYAPERDADTAFLSALCAAGVLPSAGHTDATYAEMDRAADGGCKMVTHLYSCTSTVTRENCFRRGGVLETVLLRDDMVAELIADGCHLPSELIRLVYKVKGADGMTLCTDALPVTGTGEKTSFVGGVACIVEDGVCKLQDRTAFAGSIATADRLLRFCVKDVGLPLTDVSKMLSATPARLLQLPKGKLAEGLDADAVVLDEDFTVTAVFAGGKTVDEKNKMCYTTP